ncbi:MAG TPA: T9SS type A sorting domain-containing protein, partial [Bacteroidia bacterium]|nr:T9SS type A sorting domain-containing protein [Bacteroidia bacterium]
SGNWSDHSNHWATTSGGSVYHIQVPSPLDDVFFDANSFVGATDIVIVDTTAIYCNNMDWTGATGNPTFITSTSSSSYTIRIYGSLTLVNTLTWYFIGTVNFESTTSGNTIQTNGALMDGNNTTKLMFNGIGGDWNMLDSLYTTEIYVNPGATLNTNGQTLDLNNCSSVVSRLMNSGIIDLGNSQLRMKNFTTNNSMVDADSSIINTLTLNGADSIAYNVVNMYGGPGIGTTFLNATQCTFNKINAFSPAFSFSGSGNDVDLLISPAGATIGSGVNNFTRADFMGNVTLNDSTSFDTLNFYNPGKLVTLKNGKIQNVTSVLNSTGICTGYIKIISSNSGMQATINKSGTPVVADYLILKDINAVGTSFTANNSIDNGNNTGWIINTSLPRNLYWVGNTNNWSNPACWALTSGGAGGNCPPTQNDNVFFDANSFTGSSDIVSVDSTMIFCNNMDWTGATGNPSFLANAPFTTYSMQIYGSLTLVNTLTWYFIGTVNFESTTSGNTIQTNGAMMNGNNTTKLMFNGIGGDWNMLDSLYTTEMYVNPGATFNTNNQTVDCNSCGSAVKRIINNGTLNLGTSIVRANNFTTTAAATIDADSSVIYSSSFSSGPAVDFNIVNMGLTFGTFLNASNCTFNNINATTNNFSLNGSGNDVDLIISYADATISSGVNNFMRADFMGSVTLNDITYFDTLYFDNPGKIVTIKSGKTAYVNTDMLVNSNGGFPVTIKSSIVGSNATISKPSDTVCVNYIYLQNITGTGGAVFYAGDYSFDLGGNIGWSFTTCVQPISNVWPGDANYDLTADNLDILNIGLAYNEMGFVRPGATISWTAEPCLDWTSQFLSGTNTKHADCDGNGIVDANDTMAVSLNYGLFHPPFAPDEDPHISSSNLFIDITGGPFSTGQIVSVPIKLGTSISPVNDVYGLAFTVNYDPTLIESGTMWVDYASSWLVPGTNNVHLEKDFSSTGQFDLGFSRINHLNVSGDGTVANLNFQVSTTNTGTLNLTISNPMCVDNTGLQIPILSTGDSVSIVTGINELNDNNLFSLYPNPSHDFVFLNYPQAITEKAEIQIYSLQGVLINSQEIKNNPNGLKNYKIDITEFASGTYLCNFRNGNKNTIKKITILK